MANRTAPVATPSRLLTPQQAMRRMGISESTLLRYVRSGRLTPTRLPGGHRRFDPEQIDALLAAAQEPTGP